MKYKDEKMEFDDGNPETDGVVELGGKLAKKADMQHINRCKRKALARLTSKQLFKLAEKKKKLEDLQ